MNRQLSLENAALRFVWAAIGGVVFGLAGWMGNAWCNDNWTIRLSRLRFHCSHHFSRICPRNVCMFRVFWPRSQPGFISAGIRPSRLGRELVFHSTLFGKSFFSSQRIRFHHNRFAVARNRARPPRRISRVAHQRCPARQRCCHPGAYCLGVLRDLFAAFAEQKTSRPRSFPPWKEVALIAWTGMRGVISLAAAFALPFASRTGAPFPVAITSCS